MSFVLHSSRSIDVCVANVIGVDQRVPRLIHEATVK